MSFTLFDNKVEFPGPSRLPGPTKSPGSLLPCQSKNICLQFAWLHARSIHRLQAGSPPLAPLPLNHRYPSLSLSPISLSFPWIGFSFSPLLTFGRGRFDVDYAKPIMKWLWGFDWQNIAGYKCAPTHTNTTRAWPRPHQPSHTPISMCVCVCAKINALLMAFCVAPKHRHRHQAARLSIVIVQC